MPAPRHQSSPNADPHSPTGSKRRRETEWAAERQARVVANRERDGNRRKLARAGTTRNAQPKRWPATPPLALLAGALSAGVSLRQAVGDLGISRFGLNRALSRKRSAGPARKAQRTGAGPGSCFASSPLRNRPSADCWRWRRNRWPARSRPASRCDRPLPTWASRRPL